MSRILEIWQSGGWVMIPLFALAVVLYTQAFQLVTHIRKLRLEEEGEYQWWDWVREPENARGVVRDIIHYTQAEGADEDEVRSRFDGVRANLIASIDRRVRFLSTLVAAAPLLGLLGTVLGMLQTFLGIATSTASETAGAVAGGISEALVTTQTGLTIALPGIFLVMLIQRQSRGLETKLLRLESLTFRHLNLSA